MEKPTLDKPLIKSQNLFPVVGIGASAGGLDAFKKLLKVIPEDSGMAYVLVQHLDPNHESMLPEILQKVTPIPVLEITDDIKVLPDHIYVIPSNKMMVATDGILVFAPRPAKSKTERNLPIDLFFASLAEVHQDHAIGVVLSGTASDGTQGLKAIKEQGGITFAQDEASAEYEGMPHNAAEAGVVDFILPPEEIPQKLLEVTRKTVLSDEELQNIPKQEEDVFKQILSLLRIRKGVDFTYYKQTTIRRRILRRMVVNKNEEPAEYLKFLRGNNPEQDLLYQDMLIPVTSFFRDKKVFENLCNEVFPAILKNKVPGEITRIWVAGCSTGQEVYSFAMCFKEFLGDNHERIQIFGTDLSEPAITKARTGMYEKSEVDSVSPERLKEYFTKNNGGYQVNKSIRDLCVFAHHNFLKDPPFGKMDCLSCRNVLIYMEPYLQKKALTTFHYALNPKGFLLLGKSETTGGVPELFAPASKMDKLYTRKDVPGRFMQVTSQRSEQILTRSIQNAKSETIRTDFQKTADDILLTKYTPAGVVVNEAMDIVHFRGNTANYLEQAPGKPSHNLFTMAKHGLGFELRNILHKAKTEKASVVKENIPMHVNGSIRNISIEAVPLPNTLEPYYLILFHDNNVTDTDGLVTGSRKKVSAKTKKDEKDIRIQLLEQELAQAREDMRSITEDQEASNEELQSANEELLSGSEELQSLNEELETSKEELQSTNEELTVLNHELIGLNEQVTDARNYSESIVATLYQPLLVLDKNLRVKTANKAFYKTFNVNEQETEGILIYDLGNRQWNIPELRTLLEEILPQKKQITDFEVTHNFTSIGERIIVLNALEITREKKEEKLILLSIQDITKQRLFQLKEKKILSRYHNLLLQTPVAISIYRGSNFIAELVNDSALEILAKDKNLIGKPLFQSMPELESQLKPAFDEVMLSGIPFHANEFKATLIRNGKNEQTYFNTIFEPIREDDNTISGVIVVAHEVTEQVLARKQIEDSEKRYNMMLMNSPFTFAVLKGKDLVIELANDQIKEVWGRGSDIEGKSLFEIMPELKDSPFPAVLEEVMQTGIPFFGKEVQSPKSMHGHIKEEYFFNFVFQPYLEADQTISGITIIGNEVTEQVLAKRKIEESEHRYQEMIYSSPSMIAIFKGEDMIVEIANDTIIESWGKGKDIIGKSLLSIIPEIIEQGFDKILSDVYKTGIPFHAYEAPVNLIRNGKTELLHFTFVYQAQRNIYGQIEGVAVIANEVTPQALLNIHLKESEERFRSMADNIPIHVFIIEPNAEASISYWNKNWLNYTGQTFEEAIGSAWGGIIHPDDVGPVMDVYKPSFEKRQPYFIAGVRIKRHDGEYRWHSVQANPRYLPNGEFIGYIGISMDIHEQKLAQDALKASELHFRQLADLMPAKICNANNDGKVTYFNKSWLDFSGLSFEELKDFGYHQIMHPDELEEFQNRLHKAVATGTDLLMEMRFKNADGDYIWHLNIASPVKDENGVHKMWVGVTTDITEQIKTREKNLVIYQTHAKELEEMVQQRTIELSKANKELAIQNAEKEKKAAELIVANNELVIESGEKEKRAEELIIANEELVIESFEKEKRADELTLANIEIKRNYEEHFSQMANLMPDKIITTDADGYATFFNQNWIDYTGYTFEELIGLGWIGIMHPDEIAEIQKRWSHSLSTGDDFEMEMRCMSKDDGYKWFLTRAVPIKDANGIIKSWIGTSTEIQRGKVEQERKDNFIKMVSHELKTPVTSIKGYVQMLLMILGEEHVELFPVQIKNSLLRVDHQVTRLTRLITEMLDLSRIEAGRLELQQELFNINALVKETVDDICLTNPKHTINIHFDFVCNVNGDKGRIEQVLINLVTNAIKYSANSNRIEVRVLKGEKNMVLVSIQDFGIGIEKADHKKIFDRFFRVEGKVEQTFAGFGIGLFIANEIIMRHNGYITVESEKGKGSVFTFALPYTTETNL